MTSITNTRFDLTKKEVEKSTKVTEVKEAKTKEDTTESENSSTPNFETMTHAEIDAYYENCTPLPKCYYAMVPCQCCECLIACETCPSWDTRVRVHVCGCDTYGATDLCEVCGSIEHLCPTDNLNLHHSLPEFEEFSPAQISLLRRQFENDVVVVTEADCVPHIGSIEL